MTAISGIRITDLAIASVFFFVCVCVFFFTSLFILSFVVFSLF